MIKPKEMTKIRISGAKKELRKVIYELHELKLIHLTDYTGKDFFEIGTPFEESTRYSEELIRLRSMISYFGLSGKRKKMKNILEAEKKLQGVREKFSLLSEKLNELKEKEKEFLQKTKTIEPLEKLMIPYDLLSGYESLAVFKGFVKRDIEEEIKKTTKDYKLIKSDYEGREVIALFVPLKYREKIRGVLAEEGYSELIEPAREEFNETKTDLKKAVKEIKDIEKKLQEFKKENAEFLLDLEETLRRENEKLEAPLRIATSLNSFIVNGWIPTEKLKKLNERIMNSTKGKTYVETLKEKEGAPTALDNPKIIQPFEFFLNLYSLPKYTEIDPSVIMFITFPLFFGFMLGDVGYGIVTLLLFWFIKRKMKGQVKMLLSTLMIASIATIFFGFVFGEAFGVEFLHPPLLNRAHDINLMLMISILVGAVHVTLGFIVAFYNAFTRHGFKEAFIEKGGWLILEAGAVLLILQYLAYLPEIALYAGGALILGGILLLLKGEGVKGIIELPSVISNILSYARLFAIGLSSVMLATIVNKLAGGLMEAGGIFIVMAIILVVLGHGINIALGILGPFLQSLRLHYVEFFTKFYEGGGEPYSPFGL
ncbi:MAG: V-type ATP synthase subunit I [archaeon]